MLGEVVWKLGGVDLRGGGEGEEGAAVLVLEGCDRGLSGSEELGEAVGPGLGGVVILGECWSDARNEVVGEWLD